MARMIPPIPRGYAETSREEEIFSVLRTSLDDNYCVFHSFKLRDSHARPVQEIDFVIYHRQKGILCLEVKSWAELAYHDGTFYGVKRDNGGYEEIPIGKSRKDRNGNWYREGPYDQAENAKYDILKELATLKLDKRCPVLAAVWFCSISKKKLEDFLDGQVGELAALGGVTLSSNDLREGASKTIENIYLHARPDKIQCKLDGMDEALLFRKFLCPTLNVLCDGWDDKLEMQQQLFYRLSREQSRVLDFLDGQRSIVISGTAGTGKTVVAREMAIRKAKRGDRVLFLCYNHLLCEHLKKRMQGYDNIVVKTLDGFRAMMGAADWSELWEKIVAAQGTWLYEHIIVDEGQDFGWNVDSACANGVANDLLEALEESFLLESPDDASRSFAVFYDRYQLVQGRTDAGAKLRLPPYIQNADCKLTLYRNCRNTKTVAESVMALVGLKTYLLEAAEGPVNEQTKMYFPGYPNPDSDIYFSCLITRCKELHEKFGKEPEKVVIISCGFHSLRNSLLGVHNKIEFDAEGLANSGRGTIHYMDKDGNDCSVPIYTARTFKGLEADAVILVDVQPEAFVSPDEEATRLCYTAASRARMSLTMVVNWQEGDYLKLNGRLGVEISTPIAKSIGKRLAKKFKAGSFFEN